METSIKKMLNNVRKRKKEMDIKTEIVKFLTLKGEPCKTLTISQAVGFKTRKDINPILYELQKEGILQKTSKDNGSQPHWFILSLPQEN